jgi:adenine/guanine phosphoribosyltransferase-like PRPP-binding protein
MTTKLLHVCSSYLENVFNPVRRKNTIDECIATLKPHMHNFDAIAISGYSQALIAPTVADALGKGLIIVRKDNEKCASSYEVEGVLAQKYIIIDDLICSAYTLKRIKEKIKKYHYSSAECYGIYLYMLEHSAYRTHGVFTKYLGERLLNTEEQCNRVEI